MVNFDALLALLFYELQYLNSHRKLSDDFIFDILPEAVDLRPAGKSQGRFVFFALLPGFLDFAFLSVGAAVYMMTIKNRGAVIQARQVGAARVKT